MLIAAIAMATLLGGVPDDGPAELVARLGSPRFAEREAAAESLRKLGQVALPALREAQSGRDLEIRTRALALHDEIEACTILEPTLVRLDFHDRPLSEVVEEFGRRAGVSLDPTDQPGRPRSLKDQQTWPDRRISLEAPEPSSFWGAIDRLCQAGGLRRRYPEQFFDISNPIHRLILLPGTATPPRSDAGPFRGELLRICRERELDLTPGLSNDGRNPFNFGRASRRGSGPDLKEVRNSTFFAELLLSVEPRLRIVGMASLEKLKATDSRGRSVLPAPTDEDLKAQREMRRMNPHLDPELHPEIRFGAGFGTSSTTQLLRIPLADSTPPGARMAELKGVVAVAVMGRRAEPIVLPLADAKGKTVTGNGVRLTIHELEAKPDYFHGEVELTLETDRVGDTFKVQGPGVTPLEIHRPNDLLQQELEILDDQDRIYDWSYSRPPKQGAHGRMRLHVPSRNQGGRLDFSKLRLRVSMMVGAATEFPFSFADVPMP